MPDFSRRSSQQELLDRNDIPFEDIKLNMKELDVINKRLGGHKISLSAFESLLDNNSTVSICEIGCGGGDNLRVIKELCARKNLSVKLTGIDINPHCIDFARSRKENAGIEFILSDYKLVSFENKPDIIFSSLFCHHFNDEDVTYIIRWMNNNSGKGFFINDLHRHFLAYYSIKWLSKLFSRSYLVKNDAPLSVMRGFKRDELEKFCSRVSLHNFKLKWKWAFRWLLICRHE